MENYRAPRQQTVASNGTLDLNRVRIFVQVVENGSFTAAAKRLGLPKSSVSRSVTALERSLGVRLLQRTTRAMHLTDAGRTWFQQVRPAMESLADSAASLRARAAEPSGRVRFTGAPDADELVARYVARFRRQYPRVRIDVSLTSRHVDLVAEGFDVALRAGNLKDSSLVVRKLLDSSLGLFASPAYLRRRGAPKQVSHLARHDCIAMNAPSGRASWRLTHASGESVSVEIDAVVTTDLLQFATRAALSGLGIAMLPDLMATGVAGLQRVLPEWSHVGGSLCVVSPSRGFEPRAVTLFKEGLIAELSKRDPSRWHPAAARREGSARPAASRSASRSTRS